MTNLEKAIARLKKQGVLKDFIEPLKKGTPTMFIGGAGYWIMDKDNAEHKHIMEKIKELENKSQSHNKCFAVMRYAIEDMKCYAYLLCGDEDAEKSEPYKNKFYENFAYVENETCPEFSEYGYVWTCGQWGGLVAVA